MTAVILLYHRIADEPGDPWELCVSPARFREHLVRLHGRASLVRLGDWQTGARTPGSDGPRAVVTFDDGYLDNLAVAKPLLERYEVPATVFVMTEGLNETRTFWWDDLEHILLRPGVLPSVLGVEIGSRRLSWQLGACARYTEMDFDANRAWRANARDIPTVRHAVYRDLYPVLRCAQPDDRTRAMKQLREQAAWSPREPDDTGRRGLLLDELTRLVRGGLIDVGAHSVTHSTLPDLPAEMQAFEIGSSQTTLQATLRQPVRTFAYPHGAYASDTVRVLQQFGFVHACTTDHGLVTAESDAMRLPRMVVGNWSGADFESRLDGWLRG